MIEKHQQNRQRQPPYRYSEQKGLVEMLTAVCYTKYDLSSGELAWKSPIRCFAYQKYFLRNFLFFCKIFSRIHSTWVRQERMVMSLDDSKIIDLFYARSEQAIMELSTKYGAVCSKVAKNTLNNSHDAEECVNDAYLGAWNTIPPQNPNPLLTYICRIVRNLSIMKYHANTAIKRNSFYDAALDELEDCLASSETVEDKLTAKELSDALDQFLDTLDQENRVIFVRRYWYSDSISEIAERLHMSKNNVSVRLSRTRERLKNYLKKEGYIL